MNIFFLLLALTSSAQAGVFPIFNQRDRQVTLMLAGLGKNPDAERLYEALAAGAQDEQGKFTKKVAFIDRQGVQAFSAVCVFSKLVPGSGSCTVVLKAADGMDMRFPEKAVIYSLTDPAEVARIAPLFRTEGDVYRSDDGRFQIATGRDPAGQPVRFQLSYR